MRCDASPDAQEYCTALYGGDDGRPAAMKAPPHHAIRVAAFRMRTNLQQSCLREMPMPSRHQDRPGPQTLALEEALAYGVVAGRGYGYVAVSRFRRRSGCYLYGRLRRADFLPIGEEQRGRGIGARVLLCIQ